MAQRRRRNKKWIWRLVFLILLVAAAIICYLVWDNYFNNKKDDIADTGIIEVEEKNENELEEKEDAIVVEDNDEKKVVQYEGDDPNASNSLSGVITYAGVQNEKLTIRVNIDQYLENGKCYLQLKKNGVKVYEDTVNVVGSASTATCEGFDVLTSKIGDGKMEIIITIESNNKMGAISGEVEV